MSEEAFVETGYYDAVISEYFNKLTNNTFPNKKLIYSNKIDNLRYGENPHQEAAIYSTNLSHIICHKYFVRLLYCMELVFIKYLCRKGFR